MLLIGVCGKAGSGKDTVGDRLCISHKFSRYALADPIKKMLNVIGVDANNRGTKESPHHIFGVSPRSMAQTLGTEWMRNCVHKHGWLKLAQQKYLDLYGRGVYNGMVVTDVRFANEACWIRKNGVLLHIIRADVGEVAAHSSENGIEYDPKDIVLRNDSTIEELNATVDRTINAIQKSKHD